MTLANYSSSGREYHNIKSQFIHRAGQNRFNALSAAAAVALVCELGRVYCPEEDAFQWDTNYSKNYFMTSRR